jgi:hypothetical protein
VLINEHRAESAAAPTACSHSVQSIQTQPQVLIDEKCAESTGAANLPPMTPVNTCCFLVIVLTTQVLIDEKCAENAERLGPIFRQHIMDIGSPLIQTVGKPGTVLRPCVFGRELQAAHCRHQLTLI